MPLGVNAGRGSSLGANLTQRRDAPRPYNSGSLGKPASMQGSYQGKSSSLGLYFEAKKRSRIKSKADKTFTRQYGDLDHASSASEAGPRAAVYKGEMGHSHKRATKMQSSGSAVSTATLSRAMRSSSRVGSRVLVTMTVLACLALSALFLYAPAKQYYLQTREVDRLQAEYDAVSERNDALQQEVDKLMSDEGVEDLAREELGWVAEGEQAVSVSGLDLPDEEANFKANIPPGSVKAPKTWYSEILDFVFGVE